MSVFTKRCLDEAGFTLLELIVTVSLVAILTALAVPSFRSFVQNDRLLTQATSLVLSLDAARSEAIKLDSAAGVLVCPSTDGATCAGTSNWSSGWIVQFKQNGTSSVIQSIPALSSGSKLSEKSGATQVLFQSDGRVAAAVAFTLCDSRGATYARYVQVTATGRVASSVGHDFAGAALKCT